MNILQSHRLQPRIHLTYIKSTPKVTLVERSQEDEGQFLEMLRFGNRSKLEELSLIL